MAVRPLRTYCIAQRYPPISYVGRGYVAQRAAYRFSLCAETLNYGKPRLCWPAQGPNGPIGMAATLERPHQCRSQQQFLRKCAAILCSLIFDGFSSFPLPDDETLHAIHHSNQTQYGWHRNTCNIWCQSVSRIRRHVRERGPNNKQHCYDGCNQCNDPHVAVNHS